ncbi:replication protein [Streptomyces sp. NPDC056485]|uniref:replication protein n=1 Tax=Streptomyces sp. NPDC056485 TaxID=3345834 RepID=UPI0036A1D58E
MTEFSKSRVSGNSAGPEGTVPGGNVQVTAAQSAAALRRYQGRKTLNKVSGIDACNGCGRRVLDQETGVIYGRSSRGYVVSIGLVRCGRIWFCPQCSAAIRRGRTEELKTGALRHLAAGGTLAAVVLTARHNKTTELDHLASALWGQPMTDADGAPVLDSSGRKRRSPGAYQTMLTAPAFYGRSETVSWWQRKDGSFGHSVRPAVDGIRHRIGYAGMVRASETTRSLANGWHPHMNLLVFLGATLDGTPAKGSITGYFEPGQEALTEWEDWLRGLWTGTLAKADPDFTPSVDCDTIGCKCQGKGHGVMVKIIRSADDVALIEYLTKVQDGERAASVSADLEAVSGAAMETVRADNKRGRGRKSMVPFQMLYRLWDLEVGGLSPKEAEGYGTAAQCRAWWAEYEAAMAGRRAIEWTRGLRRHVQLDGDDSEEEDLKFVYEQQTEPLTGGVLLTTDAVRTVVTADAEMELEGVVQGEFYDSVGDLVTDLGGQAGHVRVLSGEELAEVQANLFARVMAKANRGRAEVRAAEMMAPYKPVKAPLTARALTEAEADYLTAHRAANAARAGDLAASLTRVRATFK